MGFNSRLEVVTGAREAKLAPNVEVGRVELWTLLGNELGNVSEAREAEGTGSRDDGKVDAGKEVGIKLIELVLTGSNEDETSGIYEPGILEAPDSKGFEAPEGKGALKLEYCNDCCTDGGMDNPGGGRSKDCWCKCGSPFGGKYPCQYIGIANPPPFAVGGAGVAPHEPKLPPG